MQSGRRDALGRPARRIDLYMPCHNNAVFDMSWSSDDRQIATASGDRTCGVFDIVEGKQLLSLEGHANSVKQVSYNPWNPNILASSGRDGVLNYWDLRTNRTGGYDGDPVFSEAEISLVGCHQTRRQPHSITAIRWLEEHRTATACEANSYIKVWDWRSSRALAVEIAEVPEYHTEGAKRNFGITSLNLSPDHQRLYALCKDNGLYAYATNHLPNGPILSYRDDRLFVPTFFVKSSISRDGKFLATGSSDGMALLFPTNERYFSPTVCHNFGYRPGEIAAAEFMRVGRGVALVRGHEEEVTDVTWTVDNDLVTVADNGYARFWGAGRGSGDELHGGGWAERRGDGYNS